jgi:cyanate permease
MSRIQAIGVFLPASLLSVLFNFIFRWISDYIRFRYILILQLGSQLILMFFMSRLGPGLSYIMVIIAYGIVGGLFNITNSIVWPRYYGTSHLGAITGQIMSFLVTGSAVGPYFFSMIKKYTGSYSDASLSCLALTLVLFIMSFKVRRPAPPEEEPSEEELN